MAAIELFEFLVDGTYYRYTSGSVTVVKGGEDFTAEPISRSALKSTDDINSTTLTIRTMRDNPFTVVALTAQQPASVTVYGELSDSTWATIWKGRMVSMNMQGSEAEIVTEGLLSIIQRPALNARYQILCRHVLYGNFCGVTAATYKFVGTVDAVDGTALTITGLDAEANGYYEGGYCKFGTYDFRTIVSHIGDDIVIYNAVPGLVVTTAVDVYPGCDHTETDCGTKYSNLVNYGGFPWIPSGRNPFANPTPKKRRR